MVDFSYIQQICLSRIRGCVKASPYETIIVCDCLNWHFQLSLKSPNPANDLLSNVLICLKTGHKELNKPGQTVIYDNSTCRSAKVHSDNMIKAYKCLPGITQLSFKGSTPANDSLVNIVRCDEDSYN